MSCRLESNNTVEYEALLQGLRKALDMNIQNLVVFGVITGFKLTTKNSTKSYQMYNNFYQVYKGRIIPNFLNTYASKIYQ
jgi:ribonuclease HI